MKLDQVLLWKELRHKRREFVGCYLGTFVLGLALLLGLDGARPGRYVSGVVLGALVLAAFVVGGPLLYEARFGAHAAFGNRLPLDRGARFRAKFVVYLGLCASTVVVATLLAALFQWTRGVGFEELVPKRSFWIYFVGLLSAGIVAFSSAAVFRSRAACLLSVLVLGLPLGIHLSFWVWQDEVLTTFRDAIARLLPFGGLLLLTAFAYAALCHRCFRRSLEPRWTLACVIGGSPLLGFALLTSSVRAWSPHDTSRGFRYSEMRVTHDGQHLVGSAYGDRFYPWPIRVELATGERSWAMPLPADSLGEKLRFVFSGRKSWMAARGSLHLRDVRDGDVLYILGRSTFVHPKAVSGGFDLGDGKVLGREQARKRLFEASAMPRLGVLPDGRRLAMRSDFRSFVITGGGARERIPLAARNEFQALRPGLGFGPCSPRHVLDPFARNVHARPFGALYGRERVLPAGWLVWHPEAPHYRLHAPGARDGAPLAQLEEDMGPPIVLPDASVLFVHEGRCVHLSQPGAEPREVVVKGASLQGWRPDFDRSFFGGGGELVLALRRVAASNLLRFAVFEGDELRCTAAIPSGVHRVAGLRHGELITVRDDEVWSHAFGAARSRRLAIDAGPVR